MDHTQVTKEEREKTKQIYGDTTNGKEIETIENEVTQKEVKRDSQIKKKKVILKMFYLQFWLKHF